MSRVEIYKGFIEAILGRSLNNSRKREDVAGRMCIAYQLRTDGYSTSEIGKMVGRDHATILYLCKQMEVCIAYPTSYRSEYDMWEEFHNMLNLNIVRNGTETNR